MPGQEFSRKYSYIYMHTLNMFREKWYFRLKTKFQRKKNKASRHVLPRRLQTEAIFKVL